MNEPKPKLKKSLLFGEMSSFGGAKSLIGNALKGGSLIAGGVSAWTEATKKALEPGRIETFDTAMSRLGVSEEALPIIHNQMALQVYLTFFVTCIAFASTVNLAIRGGLFPALVAFFIGSAALAKMIQSSIQCEFIRERRLGIGRQWLAKPGVWLPDRLKGLMVMSSNDPLREPGIVNAMARNARAHFWYATIMSSFGAGSYFIFKSWGWPLVSFSSAAVFLLFGCSLSFEVYKRREGVICDLYPWMVSPGSWIPKSKVVSRPVKMLVEKPVLNQSAEKQISISDVISNPDFSNKS